MQTLTGVLEHLAPGEDSVAIYVDDTEMAPLLRLEARGLIRFVHPLERGQPAIIARPVIPQLDRSV
jgi:hypothetical protein